MISCGSSQNVNGGWNGQLLNSDGSTAFTFFADLKQSGGTVNVSNFGPGATGTIASCFGTSGLNETARLRGGHFAMTVSTLFPAATNNSLTLQGVQNSKGNIAGTWTSSGQPSCAATGNFSMTGVPPV
jgi:hypothetical protein